MHKYLRLATLGLSAALAFTVSLAPAALAQEEDATSTDIHPDTASWTLTPLVTFSGTTGPAIGAGPQFGPLIQASDGNIYGTAKSGGSASDGVVFKVTPAGVYTVVHTFQGGASDAASPTAALVQGTDGNFYGTATSGGGGSYGVVYKMTPSGNVTLLHVFGKSDGANIPAGLIQGTDGNLYGTSYAGGASGFGNVYKIATSGSGFTVLHNFSSSSSDCENPGYDTLIQGTDGNFYGACYAGGASGFGAVYKISSTGSGFSLVRSFAGGTTDGRYPGSGVFQATDGLLYGTAYAGGAHSLGTLYSVSSGGAFALMHSFAGGTADGNTAYAQPIQGSDGNIYGLLGGAGANGAGAVYQSSLSPGSTYNLVYSFNTTTSGTGAEAGLVQGMDGNFYGTTPNSGADSNGTVYKLTPPATFAAPVQLSVPASVNAGAGFTLSYLVTNASNDTMQQCFATNTAGDTTGWTGIKTAATTSTNASLTASSTPATYVYTLTCGGRETGMVNVVVVSNPDTTSTAVSATPGSITSSGSTSLQATVTDTTNSSSTPAGTVAFTEGSTNLGSCTLGAGTCSVTATGAQLGIGSDSVTATYTPSSQSFKSAFGSTSVSVGTDLSFTSVTHNFGSITAGTSTSGSSNYGVMLTNNSSAAVSGMVVINGSGFTQNNNCGTTLAAGAHCEIIFTFSPAAVQSYSATWYLTGQPNNATFSPSNGGTLSGTGTAATGVTLTTAKHNFGTQAVGTTSAVFGAVLTNSTSSTVTLTVAAPSGNTSSFITTLNNCGSSLKAGASCNLQYEFDPQTTGSLSDFIGVTASGGTTAVPVTVYGTPYSGLTLVGTGQ